MTVYTFASATELTRYLRSREAENKARASGFSPRSHRHSEYTGAAYAYRQMADMLERSNIDVKSEN